MNKKHPKSYSTYLRGKMAERKPIYNKNISNDYIDYEGVRRHTRW